jgi:hypothetical protein
MTTHADLMTRLDAHLSRAARRVRTRRLVVTLSVTGIALGVVGAAIASYEAVLVHAETGEPGLLTSPLLPAVLLAGVLVAVGVAWTRGVSRTDLAREVDRRLGLADRTASALAVGGGQVQSVLGERLMVETAERLDAVAGELDAAFPARPRGSLLTLLRAASIVVALWVAVILAGRLLGSGGGGRSVDLLPGTTPPPVEIDEPGTAEAEALPPDTGDDPATEDEEEEPEPEPEATPPEDEPEPEPQAPRPPAGPLATAELVLSAEEFDEGDSVLSLAVGRPGAGLGDARGFTVSVEVDGKVLGTGRSMALAPSHSDGEILPVRIGRLPGGPEALKPGQHEAVLVLEPEGGGEAVRSEPKTFRIRGGEDGGGGGGTPPPPPPTPDPESPEPEPPPPEEEQPEDGGGEDEGPPPEAEMPDLPHETEQKVVVPLFDDGPEIAKVGPRLVLVPGGAPDDPPKRMPLDEALEEAQCRAESAIDRAGVRESDRELVRRYFERLRKLLDGPR